MSMFPLDKVAAPKPAQLVRASAARRRFLQHSLRAGLGLAMFCGAEELAFGQGLQPPARTADGYFAVPQEVLRDPLMQLTRSSFARQSGDYFETIKDDGSRLILILLRIEDLASQRGLETKRRVGRKSVAQLKEESFSLIFRGPLEQPLRQRIHKLIHPTLGTLELFLVPVGQDEAARFYEVVFNRTLQ
jgi:hypothetical protein